MQKIDAFRFCVFWIWSITLVVTLAVFIRTLIVHTMTFAEIDEPLTQIMGLLIPQISVMTAFFFGADKAAQQNLVEKHRGLATFALALSALYHILFWLIIGLAIGAGIFGPTIDDNSAAAMKLLGFLSIFGLSPIAYLFATGGSAEVPAKT